VFGRDVHTLGVSHRAKEVDGAGRSTVGFEAFVGLLAVVESGTETVDL
jgi:hypothetical protein